MQCCRTDSGLLAIVGREGFELTAVLITAGCLSTELVEKRKNLFRLRTHAVVFGQVRPANRAG